MKHLTKENLILLVSMTALMSVMVSFPDVF